MHSGPVVLLGPQRLQPTLKVAVRSFDLDPSAPVAAVTAGWEEREPEDQELSDHLGGRVHNLRLWARAEEAYARDPELHAAMRARHDRVRQLQDLYRLRLRHALAAARELQEHHGDEALLGPEHDSALEAVRALDAHHLRRIGEVHAEFEARWRPGERDAVVRRRREVAQVLASCAALCIAGGHVAILLNRLRLLAVTDALGAKPVFAWSAGAMAVSERVVLFHDDPPEGAGNAEVLVHGLSLCPGVVPLPHASKRLRLDDRRRVALLARRFAPARCVALDPRTRVDWRGERLAVEPGTRELTASGAVTEASAA